MLDCSPFLIKSTRKHFHNKNEMKRSVSSKMLSEKRRKPDNNEDMEEVDRLSQLPEEILVKILSNLLIDEAVRTSILSTKWRYLWTHFFGSLEFDGSSTSKKLLKDLSNVQENERDLKKAVWSLIHQADRRYFNFIDEFLNSRKIISSTIKGLKICLEVPRGFNVPYCVQLAIDRWVKFAIQKKAQNLDLALEFAYDLSLHLFPATSFPSLQTLSLQNATLNQEMMDYLLSCCPLLQVLSLRNASLPEIIKVSSSKLKRLDLQCVSGVASLEIFAVNLMSFSYRGSVQNIVYKSVPCLVEAKFGGLYRALFKEGFLSQIRLLQLDVIQMVHQKMEWLHLPELTNLKHLELTAIVDVGGNVLNACVLLLKASPSLYKFTLRIVNGLYRSTLGMKLKTGKKYEPYPYSSHERRLKFEKENQYKLKELELLGFCGANCEQELVMNLIENSLDLKKIIVNPTFPFVSTRNIRYKLPLDFWDPEKVRKYGKELQKIIPPWIEFVYL